MHIIFIQKSFYKLKKIFKTEQFNPGNVECNIVIHKIDTLNTDPEGRLPPSLSLIYNPVCHYFQVVL